MSPWCDLVGLPVGVLVGLPVGEAQLLNDVLETLAPSVSAEREMRHVARLPLGEALW